MNEPIPYPQAWNSGRPDPTTQVTLRRLLDIKLTKFQLGFALGLLGHAPTPDQAKILDKIVNQYSYVFGNEQETHDPSKRHNAECAEQN